MTVNMPEKTQIPRLRELWKQAFGDSDAFLDGFFATGFDHRRCRCITWNDRVAAALYWFDCSWNSKKLAYIYAVATDEDFQGKGFCRNLMEDTHRHLQKLGYYGAVLVPGDRGLFTMYEKLGYRGFSPRLYKEIPAGQTAAPLQALTPEEYAARRRPVLPENSVIQEGSALSYLATFASFFESEGCLFCGGGEDVFQFQEFLGQEEKLPAIVAALQVSAGRVPFHGQGSHSAMYYPLSYEEEMPDYFGLALS